MRTGSPIDFFKKLMDIESEPDESNQRFAIASNNLLTNIGITTASLITDFKLSNSSFLTKSFSWLILQRIECKKCKKESRRFIKQVNLTFKPVDSNYTIQDLVDNHFSKHIRYEGAKKLFCKTCNAFSDESTI